MAILVQYVPIPIMGMVFAGMGMVLDFQTHDIPVPNPKLDLMDGHISQLTDDIFHF